MIVVSHWSKPAWQNMASLLVVVGHCTPHSMPYGGKSSHLIFKKPPLVSPIPLGPLTGGKGEREHGGLPPGSPRAPRGFAKRSAAVTAGLAQALEDLRGRRGRACPPTDHVRFARIECAGARPWLAGAEVCLGQPGGHRAGIAGDVLGALRGVQSLGCMQGC